MIHKLKKVIANQTIETKAQTLNSQRDASIANLNTTRSKVSNLKLSANLSIKNTK